MTWSGVALPGARWSRAAWLASRCSTSFSGVGTPCSRPSRTISPLRKSASIDPVPRVRLCQEEDVVHAEITRGDRQHVAVARHGFPDAGDGQGRRSRRFRTDQPAFVRIDAGVFRGRFAVEVPPEPRRQGSERRRGQKGSAPAGRADEPRHAGSGGGGSERQRGRPETVGESPQARGKPACDRDAARHGIERRLRGAQGEPEEDEQQERHGHRRRRTAGHEAGRKGQDPPREREPCHRSPGADRFAEHAAGHLKDAVTPGVSRQDDAELQLGEAEVPDHRNAGHRHRALEHVTDEAHEADERQHEPAHAGGPRARHEARNSARRTSRSFPTTDPGRPPAMGRPAISTSG